MFGYIIKENVFIINNFFKSLTGCLQKIKNKNYIYSLHDLPNIL